MSQSPFASQREQASKQTLFLRQKKRSCITGLRLYSLMLITSTLFQSGLGSFIE